MYKILIVDDELDVRKTLKGVLADAGHTVKAVANEGEALAAAVQETFDFACIDVRLHAGGEEDESGLSLAMALRSLKPQIRIIVFTKYIRTNQIVRAIRYHGAVSFIGKNEADWCEKVQQTIDRICQEEAKQPRFARRGDEIRLSLFLATAQPLMVRAHGRYVHAACTSNVLGLELDRYVRRVEAARKLPADLRFQVGDIGDSLWDDIFGEHPEAFSAYVAARARSQTLSVIFEAPREFLGLPLEFMRCPDPSGYMVLQHPLTRLVCNVTPRREVISPEMLALKERLQVLIIASNTLPQINGVDIEAKQLQNYLQHQGLIPLDVTYIPSERATYGRVKEELRNHRYDIIHYAGHGSYKPSSPEESGLSFWAEENRQGGLVRMKAAELEWLFEQSETHLVYLSCCYGTATGSKTVLLDDDFLGLADAAVQAGVPSVLGFRWPVSDGGARRLALAFYKSLLEQGSPEIALWCARGELAAWNRNDPTWLSPILIHQE